MVDQSELAFRLLVRQHGADVAFSQMMHARNFVNDRKYRSECVDWLDYSNSMGTAEASQRLDRPLIVQLAGDNPATLVKAGQLVHHDAAAVDLNLGCPQKIAKTGNYGAYLLPQRDTIVKCLSALVQNLACPVTAKIRVLDKDEDTLALCLAIEATGISMLTVHGRTVDNNKLFVGAVNWDIIGKIKQAVSIPVVANGGIATRADALRCLDETGCDGVMSSEALLENPKLFSAEGDRAFREDYVRAQLATVAEYVALVNAHALPRPLFQVTRSHLFKMLHRFVDCKAHADLREQLATGDWATMQAVYWQLRDRLAAVDFNTPLAEERGLIGPTGWYYRHRDARAETRILSLPRRRATSGARGSNLSVQRDDGDKAEGGSDEVSAAAAVGQRLSALKERLASKRQGVAAVPAPSSSFSRFIAKVDS